MNQLPESKMGRGLGITMLLLGMGGAFWLKQVYDTRGGIPDIVIFVTPFLIILGLVGIAQPNLMKSLDRRNKPHPLMVLTMVFSIALGVALRAFVFKGWE